MHDQAESPVENGEARNVPPASDILTSDLIGDVADRLTGETVLIGTLILKFRRRSFGGIFLILSALGLLPGISTVAGVAMLIPAVQLMLGFRAPLLPRFVRRRRIRVELVRNLAARAIPIVRRIEKLSKPRWPKAAGASVQVLVGALSIGLALLIMLPLPFTNFPPALAFLAISIGLMERDGVFICIGIALSIVSILTGVFIGVIAFDVLVLFLT